MRSFWFDLFVLSCIYVVVGLALFFVGSSLNLLNSLSLIIVPIAFFAVAGGGFLFHRIMPRGSTQRPVQFRKVVASGGKRKSKRSHVIKNGIKPVQAVKPRIEFGFHTCPVHGIEKCAGNYLNLHSCNDTIQTSTKQIFWKEITPALPSK